MIIIKECVVGNETEKILDQLDTNKTLTKILEENKEQFDLLTIGEYIKLELINKKLKKENVIKNSGIVKRYFNQIIADEKTPSRRYIIRIFLSLQLDLVDIQWYLRACDYNQLYAKNKRDAIIIYCINKELSVNECNKMLNNVGLENLGFENTRR